MIKSQSTDVQDDRWHQIMLGTAQFGLAYGRRKGKEPLNDQVVNAILEKAWSLGVRAFDTAERYGNAAARLDYWLRTQGKLKDSLVVTKISPQSASEKIDVEKACRRFVGAGSIMLLSHGPIDQRAYSKLRTLANTFGAEAGQSVYSAFEVETAARAGVTRVQAPLNVLDLRQLETAHRSRVAIDGRSVYLQGLLLDAPAIAERRLAGAGAVAQAVQTAARAVGLSTATALLAGVLAQLWPRDRAVIGIDAEEQLEEVASALEAPGHLVEMFLSTVGKLHLQKLGIAFLDPRTWQ